MENKQVQKAGDGSQQFQMVNPTFNIGITEERAREIFTEMNAIARQNYTQDAYETANRRVERLEQIVMPRLAEIEGALPFFADPEFQFLLRKAQQSAAKTENENDYALLTELLTCHIQKKDDRKARTGISKATEIVSEIDNEALCAMTVVHAVNRLSPQADNCKRALDIMDEVYRKLLYLELPSGEDWIEHLEILNAIRILQISNFKKMEEFILENWNGIVCVGIKIDSAEYQKALEIISSEKLPEGILRPNDLLEGYVRIPLLNDAAIDNLSITYNEIGIRVPFSNTQKQAVRNIWNLYSKDESMFTEVRNSFIEMWDEYQSLKQVRKWWNSIPQTFVLTSIGTVLAHANAQRCDNNIPDLI